MRGVSDAQRCPGTPTTPLLVVGITTLVALLPRIRGRQIDRRIALLFGRRQGRDGRRHLRRTTGRPRCIRAEHSR